MTILMSRSQSTLRRRPTGSEPGINPRGGNAGNDFVQSSPCLVEVMDYSTQHVASSRFSNAEFLQFLEKQTLEEENQHPDEASLRWINVGGISWDILSTLALRYGWRVINQRKAGAYICRYTLPRPRGHVIGTGP